MIKLHLYAFKKVKMLELISEFTAKGSQVWMLMDILSAVRAVKAFLGHQSSELVKQDATHAETWEMILKKFLIVKGSSDSMQMFWLKPARLKNH